MAPGDRALRLVAVADLGRDRVAVVRIETTHHALHAQLERRANTHADRVLHRPQQVGGAPAAHHRALARDLQHLVGGVDGKAGLVGGEPLEQVGFPAQKPDDVALPQAHLVSEVVDHLAVDHRHLELGFEDSGDIHAEGTHFARHCDQRHKTSIAYSQFRARQFRR